MKVIVSQQGSGSRILASYYGGFDPGEFFAQEPDPTEAQARKYLESKPDFRLMYNHLEAQPWLYSLLKEYEVIHLYRDPGRTFTRKMAKYREVKAWTRQDLIDHVEYVKNMRELVNKNFDHVSVTHYEDFIRDLYLGELQEFNHL